MTVSDIRRKTPSNVVSSEIIGAIQRQVIDHPGINDLVLMHRLSRRFSVPDLVGTINRLSGRHGVLDRAEDGGLTIRVGDD